MLNKETKTTEVVEFYLDGYGPYKTAEDAFEFLIRHRYGFYEGGIDVDELLKDKELLIALGEWAKNGKE